MVHRHGAMTGRVRPHPGEIGGLAGPRARKTVSLALQGGGAHGAFTWGVLDALPLGAARRLTGRRHRGLSTRDVSVERV